MTLKTTEIINATNRQFFGGKKRNLEMFGNSDKHGKRHRSSVIGMEEEVSLETSVSLKGYLEKTKNKFMFINSTI